MIKNKKLKKQFFKNAKRKANKKEKTEDLTLPFCIKTEKEKEGYLFYKQCTDYIETFVLTRPYKSTSHEYRIIREAVKELTPITTPYKLAKLLNLDIELIHYGIEKGYIEIIKNVDEYVIKTAEIMGFLKKFSNLLKTY